MIPLTKDCACTTHAGPCALDERDCAKARRLAVYAALRVEAKAPGYTRAQGDLDRLLVASYAAEAMRDDAAHCRWMARLRLAAFCRGCWQGFRDEELPATCGCGRVLGAQPPLDLLALAVALDLLGAWPPRDLGDTGTEPTARPVAVEEG